MDEVKQNHELAEHDYMFGMKYKDIAAKYDVTINTVKSWKTRYGWSKDKEKGVHTKPKKVCTQNKRGAQKEEVAAKEVEQVIENPNLTDKQQLFCLYYVKYRNKTKAYQKAYECSLANAQAHSYELWKKVEVRKEVNRLLAEYRADIELDIKDLFQWYLDIARADVNDFIVITSKGLKMRNETEIDGVLISEVKEGQYGISVKLQEKHKALSWLGEHIGLATEEQKARIDVLRAKAQIVDTGEIADDGFLDALNGSAKEDWIKEDD